jgi:hypothetical protein
MVAVAAFTVWRLTGSYEPEPLTRQDHQSNLVYYTAFAAVFAGFAVKAWWQQRRERPKVTPTGPQPPTGSETPVIASEGPA